MFIPAYLTVEQIALSIEAVPAHDQMMEMPEQQPGSANLARQCRAASHAYDIAAEALDAGLRREGGATAGEWKAEFDARMELRAARAAYVADARGLTAFRGGAAFVSSRSVS